MDIFGIEEVATPSGCAGEEPDGCEICGHCRLVRRLLLERAKIAAKSPDPVQRAHQPQSKEQ